MVHKGLLSLWQRLLLQPLLARWLTLFRLLQMFWLAWTDILARRILLKVHGRYSWVRLLRVHRLGMRAVALHLLLALGLDLRQSRLLLTPEPAPGSLVVVHGRFLVTRRVCHDFAVRTADHPKIRLHHSTRALGRAHLVVEEPRPGASTLVPFP